MELLKEDELIIHESIYELINNHIMNDLYGDIIPEKEVYEGESLKKYKKKNYTKKLLQTILQKEKLLANKNGKEIILLGQVLQDVIIKAQQGLVVKNLKKDIVALVM